MLLTTIFITLLTPVLSIILILLFTKEKALMAVFGKVIVLHVVGFILSLINIKKGKHIFDKKYWKFGLSFNIPLLAYYLSLSILNQSDRVMINYFVGTDKAGIYSIAYSLGIILTLLNSAINGSFIPWEFKNIKSKNTDKISNITNLILIFTGLMNLLLIIMAPEIIHIFTPTEYHSAIWIIPPVALSSYLMCLYQFFVNIEFYYERKTFIMIASIIVSILNIILNRIFIPLYGFIAAGYTTFFSYFIFTISHYYFMKKIIKNNENIKNIYNIKFVVLFSLFLFIISGITMMLYNFPIIKYSILILFLVLIIIYRNRIISIIKNLFY